MKPRELPSHLPGLLRAAVLAGAATVFCWPLTVSSGVTAKSRSAAIKSVGLPVPSAVSPAAA